LNNMTFCYSQGVLKHIPAHIDIGVTSNMVDSLRKENVSTFFLYLTTISKSQINNNPINNRDSIEVTYFIWKQAKHTHISLITDSCIYKDILLQTDTIFKYPYLNKTWLRKDEDIYKFVCPINTPYDKDILIYINPKSKLFFEIGKNASYKLNPTRNKYRYEFIKLLKSSITQANQTWVKLKDYDRWVDFPENKE